jgi:hypothetical protein
MRTARVILLVAVFSTMSLCVSASGQHISRNLSDLPIIAQAGISAALGRDIPAYYAHPAGGGFEAANPSQELIIDFTSQGIEVRNRDARWRMTLRGYGYGAALNAVETVAPTVSLNRVQYWREGITEWYVNGPVGLEQGFTVDRPGALWKPDRNRRWPQRPAADYPRKTNQAAIPRGIRPRRDWQGFAGIA